MRDLVRGLRSFWNDPSGRSIFAICLTVIGVATVFYRIVEDLRWIDSLYFSVITVSTVGYGDVSPESVPGKIFTMVFAIVGIGVFVALVSTVAYHLIEAKKPDEAK